MSRLPYDLSSRIREMATDDTSWGEPPIVGYLGSPLAAAMKISHVCKEWRSEILHDATLWGRLLNTIYYPTSNDALWKLVYQRSGDSPIWLRYIDMTIPNAQDFSQKGSRMKLFTSTFLTTLEDTAPDRIQRLEINISQGDELWKIPEPLRQKISEVVARHATHMTLGNAYYAGALALPQNPYNPVGLQWGIGLSIRLLGLVFGNSLTDPGCARRLKDLRMHSMSLEIESLLCILRSSPDLEWVELCIGAERDYQGSDTSGPGAEPVIHLPRLRVCNINSSPGMGRVPTGSYFAMADALSDAFHFGIEGKFKTYYLRCSGGRYEVERVGGVAPKLLSGL